MPTPIRVLILEDRETDAKLMAHELRQADFEPDVQWVDNGADFIAALATSFDVILSDYVLPQFTGPEALRLVRERGLDTPFILVSGEVGEELVIEAMREGANDYVMKDRLLRLGSAVRREIQAVAVRREQRRVAAALHEETAQLAVLVERSSDGIAMLNGNGCILYGSPSSKQLLGYTMAEIVGRHFSEFVHPEDRDSVQAEFAAIALRPEGIMGREVRGVRRDGAVRWYSLTVSNFLHVPGVEGLVVNYSDVTEKKESIDELHLRLSALEASANAIVITDIEGRIEWANGAFTALTGYSLAEATGRNPRDLVRSGHQDKAFYRNLWETILAGEVWRGELVNRRKDSGLYTEEMTITPVRNEQGKITRFIAIKQDITLRRSTEASLRLFRTAIGKSIDPIMIIDPDSGRFVQGSTSAWSLFGYTLEEFERLTVFDIVVGLDRATFDRIRAELAAQGHATYARTHRRKDGTTIEMEVSLSWASLDRNYVVAIGRDITERQNAEKALRQSEGRLQSITGSAQDAILMMDQEGRVSFWNPAAERILGYTHEEVIGRNLHELLAPAQYLKAHRRAFEIFQQTGAGNAIGKTLDLEAKRKDGTEIAVQISLSAIHLDTGWHAVGILRDVTQQKQAEKQLREQNEIIANSHEGVMIVNLSNQVTWWNRTAEKLLGWPASEAIGRQSESVLGLYDESALNSLRRAVEHDGHWSGDLRGQRRDGSPIVIHCSATMVRDLDGKPRARLNIFEDVTEQKLLEARYFHAQRLEGVGMLAAGIAHDLNNILTPIMFALPMLADRITTPHDKKILKTMEDSTARGAALVKQILGFARATAGEFQPIQTKHIARDIVNLIEQTFPRSIQLEQSIPTNLWVVQGNATQIHQVLLNLCVNARDAMPGGGTLRINASNLVLTTEQAAAIHDGAPGRWVVLEVADTGTGISPEILKHLWEPFFTTKAPGKGTGLGLSTVRSIVMNHRGFIEIHTAAGKGTSFRVYLPASEMAEFSRPAAPLDAHPEGRNELVMVVDDDALIRELVSETLNSNGYHAVSFRDGLEAVTYFQVHAEEVSLVVTDVDMPNLDGVALARALLLSRPEAKLIAMSGVPLDGKNDSSISMIQEFVEEVLAKPFKPEQLLAAVHRLLHQVEHKGP